MHRYVRVGALLAGGWLSWPREEDSPAAASAGRGLPQSPFAGDRAKTVLSDVGTDSVDFLINFRVQSGRASKFLTASNSDFRMNLAPVCGHCCG